MTTTTGRDDQPGCPMITADDFRIRKIPGRGFIVSQLVGSGWERLSDAHPTREAARQFINRAVGGAR